MFTLAGAVPRKICRRAGLPVASQTRAAASGRGASVVRNPVAAAIEFPAPGSMPLDEVTRLSVTLRSQPSRFFADAIPSFAAFPHVTTRDLRGVGRINPFDVMPAIAFITIALFSSRRAFTPS
jgi:hypothetical protein